MTAIITNTSPTAPRMQNPVKEQPAKDSLSNRLGLLSGVVLLGVIMFQSSVFVVNYDEVGLRARFGTLNGILTPGIHVKIPFGIDQIEKVSAGKITVLDFGFRDRGDTTASSAELTAERSMITADLNTVEIAMAVQYQVDDPIAYLSSVRDAEVFVRAATEAIVREIVGGSESGALYTTSGQIIAGEAKTRLQAYLDAFDIGVAITAVDIREIAPPTGVRPAFDKVNEARQEKERRISEAERQAGREVAVATGEAARIRADAEAEAMRRDADIHGHIARLLAFDEAYRSAPQMVRTSLYLDTMTAVLPKLKSILVTPSNTMPTLPLLDVGAQLQD